MPPASRLRLLLLLATGLVTLVVRFSLLESGQTMGLVILFGYWAIAAIAITAIGVGVKAFKGWSFSWAYHGWPLVAAVVCAIFLQIHEPRKLRVLYDEYVLITTSLQMHLERAAAVPAQAQYDNGRIIHPNGFADKRPLLFPFLLSLVHDLTGYRVANVFVLNAIISVALFWLVFWLGEAIGGQRFGYAGVLLVAGIPLLANVATSGIFDLLNLALLAAFILAARRYLETPSGENQNLFVMAGVLIAQSRYESILFLLPLAFMVALTWWRNRRVEVTRLAVAAPLMILLPLMCNLLHVSNKEFTQHQSVGVEQFDFANFIPNLSRDVYYLFNFSGLLTNSPLVSFAGVVSMLLVIVGVRSTLSKPTHRPGIATVFFAITPVVIGNVGIMLFYWWGQFDDSLAARFSLPLQLTLIFAILLAVAQFRARERAAAVLIGVASISIWAWTIPTSARHATTLLTFTSKEVEWQVSQVLARFDHRTLVFSESALPFVAHRRPSLPFVLFNKDPRKMWQLKTQGLYDELIFFQTIKVDPTTGEETDISNDAPSKALKLELIVETRFHENIVSRLSRWVGFNEEVTDESGAKVPEGGGSEMNELERTAAQSVTGVSGTSMP